MKRVVLLHDTAVRYNQGTVLEVSDEEAKRLIAFGNAEEAKAPKEAKAEPADTVPVKKKAPAKKKD